MTVAVTTLIQEQGLLSLLAGSNSESATIKVSDLP